MRGRWAMAAVVAGLGAAALLRPPAPFTADAGPKLLQALAFAGGGWQPGSVPYPAAELDPERRWIPPFMAAAGDGLVSTYPVLFPVLAAAPVAVLGERGAWLVPLLAAVATACLAGGMVRRLAGGDAGAAATAVLAATPLAFYALTLWEQSTAAALVVAAVGLVATRPEGAAVGRWATAGLLLGTAFWVRTEVVVMLPLLAAPALARRQREAVAGLAGAAAGLLAGAAAQRLLLGSWLPLHLGYHSAPLLAGPGAVRERVETLAAAVAPDPVTAAATGLWLVALAAALHPGWRRRPIAAGLGIAAAVAAGAAAFAGPAWRWLAGASPTESFPFSAPVVTWLPLAALPAVAATAPASLRGDRRVWAVAGAAAWYLLAVSLAKPARSPEWGHRVLLPAVVLLVVVLLVLARDAPRWVRALTAACLAGGVAVQALGVALARHGASVHSEIVAAVLEATGPGDAVVTDTPIVVLGAGAAFLERRFLFCASDESFRAVAGRLGERGERELTVATVPGLSGGRFDAGSSIGGGCGAGWRLEEASETRAGRRTLRISRYRPAGPAGAW